MKKLALILSILFTLPIYADVDQDIDYAETKEELVSDVIKIKDVKAHLLTLNPDTTCLDEYVKRRKQVLGKLIASPVIIAAGTSIGFVAGAYAGLGIASIVVPGSMEGLGYVVGGALLMGTAGAGATITDSGLSIFEFRDLDLISKAIAEQQLGKPGLKSDKLYANYTKKHPSPLSQEAFFQKLMELDESGKLCDGSMVKQPRIKLGFKLKYKVARTKQMRIHF